MRTLILASEDMQRIVHHVGLDALMDELIERLTTALTTFDPAVTSIPARSGFSYTRPHPGLIEWMPLMQDEEHVVLKVVGYHPMNPSVHNLPTIVSTVSAYDTASGHLIGLVDGVFLTALRTGAASAVASRFMGRPDSRRLGLVGCGAQAVTQLHALSRVFDLDEVLLYDTDPAVLRSFPARIAGLGLDALDVRPAAIEELVGTSDLICTATSVDIGAGPVFDAALETRPWVHVNAVGSDFPGKIELPRSLLQASFVCPDFLEQAVKEGECQQLDASEIGPSLAEMVRAPDAYQYVQQCRSVFDSTGWALEDHEALEMLLEHATTLGLGTSVEIEGVSADPRNPYAFIAAGADLSIDPVPTAPPALTPSHS